MDSKLIDIVLEQWARQDEAGVPRWAFFLCSTNGVPFYPKGHASGFGDGHNSATTDEPTAREMFKDYTLKGKKIGVAGGVASGGIVAFDIDIKKENTPAEFKDPDNIEKFIEYNFGDLPKSETQTTRSGGRHILFYDKTMNSRNDAFEFNKTGLSIDIKGNGGYFILYESDINFENIADAPAWIGKHLYNLKKEKDKQEASTSFAEKLTEGNRNSGLTSIAGRFYNYGDDINVFSSFLHGHNILNCDPPLPAKDVDRIIKSAIDNFKRDYEKSDIPNIDDEPAGDYDFNCLADFCVEVEDEKFVIAEMITEGSLTIFTGKSGSGKTWVTTDLCLSVALGEAWLGKDTIKKNVLIVDEESGRKRLIRRMRKLVAGRGLMELGKDKTLDPKSGAGQMNVRARSFRRTDIGQRSFVSEYKELILRDNIGLILFDALVDITPDRDENDSKEMTPALLNLKRLCEETGVTIIVIHHAGKSDMNDSRGTSAIEGAIDAMFKITPKGVPGCLEIESKKERDIQKIKMNAELKYSDFTVVLEICSGKEIDKGFHDIEIKILKYLYVDKGHDGFKAGSGEIKNYIKNLGGVLPSELKNFSQSVNNHFKHLESKGFLKAEKSGEHKTAENIYTIIGDFVEVKKIIDKGHNVPDEDE